MGTQLYNKEGQKIYPAGRASDIDTEASGQVSNVETNLKELWNAISGITGDGEAVDNITVTVEYTTSNSDNVGDLEDAEWRKVFELPRNGEMYVWKKTEFSYKGNVGAANTIYEIVFADAAERTQNIYTAVSTTSAAEIKYPILKDGYGEPILGDNGEEQEDLAAFDNTLPSGWSEVPVSITPSQPYTFISTRKRVDGKWQRFSDPAQFGRWAFDSQLELRYRVITDGSTPQFNATSDDPGSEWTKQSPTDFTGKLWMITATSVNGVINADSEGIRWKGPNLMAIIQ